VAEQPVLRVYREQIYSPKAFVFRVALPHPTLADRIRITIGQPCPTTIRDPRSPRYAQGP